MSIEFKYQTLFTCSVPRNFTLLKDFNEMIASDHPMRADALMNTISLSFTTAGLDISEMLLSNDLNHCDVLIKGAEEPVRIIIRQRPSLVANGQIFKLEEFDL